MPLLLLLLLLLPPRPSMWQRLVRKRPLPFLYLADMEIPRNSKKVRGTVSTCTVSACRLDFHAVSACGCYEGSEGERWGVRDAGAKGAGLAAEEAGIGPGASINEAKFVQQKRGGWIGSAWEWGGRREEEENVRL